MASPTLDNRLAKFCEAVRAKDNWIFKIGTLGEKWAEEAKLITPGIDIDQRVVDTLWELTAEAERIREIDYRIHLHSDSLPERPIDYARIAEDVKSSVKYARTSQYALKFHEHRDRIGIVVSDGLVPKSLHEELVKELDALASAEPKDFHPGTTGKVQDLIHPSTYPYIGNTTPVNPGVKLPRLRNGKFETSVDFDEDMITHTSEYAWVPSIFTVANDHTEVSIDSYINGLGPRERYPNLYRLIEKVFLVALPHFERTLKTKFGKGVTASIKRWEDRWDQRAATTKENWEALLAKQAKEKEQQRIDEEEKAQLLASQHKAEFDSRQTSVDPSDPAVRTSLDGQTFKVIVKAANYILKPGQEYKGTWHLEGMPHERIVASTIYYYDTNEYVRDDGLGFRRARREEEDFPGIMELTHENFAVGILKHGASPDDDDPDLDSDTDEQDYPSDWDDTSKYVPLGTVPTTFAGGVSPFSGHGTGRIISFPNWVQHKVQGLRHASASSDSDDPPAIRKILCFFLVDDSNTQGEAAYPGMTYKGLDGIHVLSTSDIPQQNCATNVPTLRILLPLACKASTGKTLPPELVDVIVDGDFGLTREMAEKHRRGFMDDRRIKVTKESNVFDDEYSLCEH